MISFFKKRAKSTQDIAIKSLRFVPGAVPYQGSDDVTYVLFALIIAIRACEQSKHLNAYQKFLLLEWNRLLLKNHDFMKRMEVENFDLF